MKYLSSIITLCLTALSLSAANVPLTMGPGMDGIGGGIGDKLGGNLADGIGSPPAKELSEQPQEDDNDEDEDNDGNDDENGGCASGECNFEACDRASSSSGVSSVMYQIGLGRAEYIADGMMRDGGVLFRLRYDTLSGNTDIYQRPLKATMMQNQPPTGDIRVDSAGRVQQVLTRTLFTDLVDLPVADGVAGYKVTLYCVDQTKPALVGNLYNTASIPIDSLLKVIIVRNPDGIANNGRFEILEEDYFVPENAPRCQTIYWQEGGSNNWVMEKYAGVRGENSAKITRRVTLSGRVPTGGPFGEYRQTRIVEKADSAGILHEVIRYSERCARYNPVETVQLERSMTIGNITRTNIREYHTAIDNEAAFGRPKSFRRWDGYWETYDYEPALGEYTLITVRRPWLNSTYGNVANCVEESWLENHKLKISLNHTKKIAGQVVSKTTLDRRDQGNGTLVSMEYRWTSNENTAAPLVTRRAYYSETNANTFLRGRLKSEENPDGTVVLYSYEKLTDGSVRFTIQQGAGSLNEVTDGSKTVHLVAANGQLLDEVRTDIATGLPIYRQTATSGAVDPFGRVTEYSRNDDVMDTTFERYGSCGALLFRRDSDGHETRNQYDEQKRLIRSEAGYLGDPAIVTEYEYSFSVTGKTIKKRVIADGQTHETVTMRNLLGDIISTQDPDLDGDGQPEITTYLLTLLPEGGTRFITTYSDGATAIVDSYRDEQTRRNHGTARVETHYNYGLWENGEWNMLRIGAIDSETWTKTYSDLLGRHVKTETHLGDSTLAITSTCYNAKDQIEFTNDADGLITLYAYNALGEQTRVALDLNNNGIIDLTGPDRIIDTERRNMNHPDLGSCEEIKSYIYPNADNGTRQIINTTWRSYDGLKNREETLNRITTNIQTRPVNGTYTITAIDPAGNRTIATYTQNRLISQTVSDSQGAQMAQSTYTYDALGQILTQTVARTGTTVMEYDTAGQLKQITAPDGSITRYIHDNMGRVITTILSDNTEQHTAYDSQGRAIKTWGAQQYTIANIYDTQGHLTELHTFKDGDAASPQITRWIYDAGGRLLQKRYADNHGPIYTYSPGGRLLTRTWARNDTDDQPLITAYIYTNAGELASVNYSDATPDVNNTYDRLGRQTAVTDGTGTRTYAYRADNLLPESETYTGLFNATIAREYDLIGRLTKTQYGGIHANTYAYDIAGRINTITGNDETYTYAYLPNSNLIANITGPQHTVFNTYEPHRDILLAKENKIGNTIISKHTYTVNSLGQRIQRQQTGTAFATPNTDAFTYNVRGELTGSSNTQRPTFNTSYNYDGIGNRQTSADGFGLHTYTSNGLNQYTSVSFAPSIVKNPSYDFDGNMLSNGDGTAYTWDAENRLIKVTKSNGTDVRYTYDSESRRVKREYYENNTLQKTIVYLYDGWNVIAEYEGNGTDSLPVIPARTYTWGLDLSNTLQGAGGIGGLLSMKDSEGVHAYTYDGNGNVSEVIANNAVVAHYEYDPFGNIIVQNGTYATTNPWRFSTKPFDEKSGLYYYGYRWYNAIEGRWINRDPIGFRGGINLYGFLQNSSIFRIDLFGLCTPGEKDIINIDVSIGGFRNRPDMQRDIKKLFAAQKGVQVAQLLVVTGGMVYFITADGVFSVPTLLLTSDVIDNAAKTTKEFINTPGFADILNNIANTMEDASAGYQSIYTNIHYKECQKKCLGLFGPSEWGDEKKTGWKKCHYYEPMLHGEMKPTMLENCKIQHTKEFIGK